MRNHAARFRRLGLALVPCLLPTVFAGVAADLKRLIATHKPDGALHIGVAGRRKKLSVEMRGVNAATILRQDAKRRCNARRIIAPELPAQLRSTFPGARIAAAMIRRAIPAALSVDAGDYVCNQTLFLSLALAQGSKRRVGFIHIPRPRAMSRPRGRGRDMRPTAAQIETAIVEALLVMARSN